MKSKLSLYRTRITKVLRPFFPELVLAKWRTLRLDYLTKYAKESYSQEGEDMILGRIFGAKPFGVYVDIGAHHPKRFSNTYSLYKLGWSGLNIDAMPGSMELFRRFRPRDINLEVAISDEPSALTFYVFDESALNTFDQALAEERDMYSDFNLTDKITLSTRRLSDVLDEFLPKNTKIDFMSVDVEGIDIAVLTSNNWQRFRPTYLLVECIGLDISRASKNSVVAFLQNQNYAIFAKTFNTVFFRDETARD